MSNCNFTSSISSNEYIGNSLITLNNNTSALDFGVCAVSNSISVLEDISSDFIESVQNVSNALYNLFSYASSGHVNQLYSNLNVLVSTISAGTEISTDGTGIVTGNITLSSFNIPASASIIVLSGYPVGCSYSGGNTILFTVNGVNMSDVLFAINNSESYKYVWYYGQSCLNRTYKIYLMGYI